MSQCNCPLECPACEAFYGNKNAEVYSYNAGYHRGLNTEYHDIPVETLYENWLEELELVRTTYYPDLPSFRDGYNEGLLDYKESFK